LTLLRDLDQQVPFRWRTRKKKSEKRRTNMKTTLRNIAATIGLSMVLGSATLIAETWTKSIATIPFDFQVRKSHLPAGKYAVDYVPDSRLIVLRNLDTRKSIMTLAQPAKGRTLVEPKLTFQYDGERYTMSEVWFGGGDEGFSVAPLNSASHRERGMVATVRLQNK